MLNQEILDAIQCYYVELKLFFQKVGLVLHELPIIHGKGTHPGLIAIVEIDFQGINFEVLTSFNLYFVYWIFVTYFLFSYLTDSIYSSNEC